VAESRPIENTSNKNKATHTQYTEQAALARRAGDW